MIFDDMLRRLKEGIEVELGDVEITEEFMRRYNEYQERVKIRESEDSEY